MSQMRARDRQLCSILQDNRSERDSTDCGGVSGAAFPQTRMLDLDRQLPAIVS